MLKIGIDQLGFYVPKHFISLSVLAEKHGIDPEKFSRGIGQNKISMPSHDEDVVTLGAEAAKPILDRVGVEGIDTLLFATETGIDQSKAGGVYVHRLLGLPSQCRVVELKHACYSGTAALQLACGYVARKPHRKVLVIASDISRYDIDSSAEATQGCGAVAMLVTANPRVLEIETASGCHSEDIMDFWRPNYRKTPLVDGKYSALKYLDALGHAWKDYQTNGGRAYHDIAQFCYHLPFSRLGVKAHQHLAKLNGASVNQEAVNPGLAYNRDVGNSYTASLYISLISTLDEVEADLSSKAIGLFSYGSGAVAEFFTTVVQPGYREYLSRNDNQKLLSDRVSLSHEDYLTFWHAPDPTDGSGMVLPKEARGSYRLARIDDHKRHYEAA
ncbi:MAG: hydroxymethylglutaryl-CoA synthase [Pseudomonadota bacterium]